MNTTTIGFIGTGVMGTGMIRNLLKAGFPVNIYTRTKSKADALISEGCQWFESPSAVAAASDVVISIVGYPKDVEEVYLGDNGILKGKKAARSST